MLTETQRDQLTELADFIEKIPVDKFDFCEPRIQDDGRGCALAHYFHHIDDRRAKYFSVSELWRKTFGNVMDGETFNALFGFPSNLNFYKEWYSQITPVIIAQKVREFRDGTLTEVEKG